MMINVVYSVIRYDDYYPSPDNTVGTFTTRTEAWTFLEKYKELNEADDVIYDNYKIVELKVYSTSEEAFKY